jgi:hypothetical protein
MIRCARWLLLSVWPLVSIGAGCDGSPDPESPSVATEKKPGAKGGPDAGEAPGQPGTAAVLPAGVAIEHILSTGQSNAVGLAAKPPLSTSKQFGNVMFDRGVMTARDCGKEGCTRYEKPSAFAALAEGDTYYDEPVETMSSGMADEISRLRAPAGGGTSTPILVSVHGRSGNTYWCLRKGGCSFLGSGYLGPFAEALMQVRDAKALAAAGGHPYAVRAVTAVHGESNHYTQQFPLDGSDGTPGSIATYADAMLEWQRDYETEIKAVTGQSEAIPLFISQMGNWNDRPNSDIPIQQLDAHARSGGHVILIGPTYALPYATDCIHFTNHGERQLGEYFAKAYAHVVLGGRTWEPVRPRQITAAGNVVTIRFHVPKPPLVLDTTLVTNPGSYGFEVIDAAGSSVAITDVTIAGPDTVTLSLGGSATGGRVRYAFTAQPETCPGPQFGPRGNLRDSDDTPSNNGYRLYDWAVTFDSAIEP